jgi:hypothetical protein
MLSKIRTALLSSSIKGSSHWQQIFGGVLQSKKMNTNVSGVCESGQLNDAAHRDIALMLSGVAGLLHWGWWCPVLFGAIAAVVREASQGFVLIQQCGSGYLIRSITMTCLLCGVVATVAYMLSESQGACRPRTWRGSACQTFARGGVVARGGDTARACLADQA